MARILMLLAAMLPGLAAAQDRPVVMAVNYPLAWMAERLAGDAAEVVLPVPPGVDPQFWRPAIAEISAIQSAELIVLNGAGFAAWTARVSLPRARSLDTSRGFRDRLIATGSVTHSHGADGAHSHEGTAAYVWLDPALAALQARAVAEALTRALPGQEAAIAGRLGVLEADLAGLSAMLDGLAPEGQAAIATHPRYQYLARAMGLTIHALEWEAGAEPTPDQLAELAALAARTGARVLIWEAEPPAAAREAVAGLGLADAVVPTLAMPPATGEFLSAYRAGLEALAAAFAR